MTAELKPCPFCGGAPTLIDRPDGPLLVGAFVTCDACDIGTPILSTAALAIEAWNTRAPVAAQEKAPARETGAAVSDEVRAVYDAIAARLHQEDFRLSASIVEHMRDAALSQPVPPVKKDCWACSGFGVITTSSGGSGLIEARCLLCEGQPS
jgi:Lar family restriction alleviation protein